MARRARAQCVDFPLHVIQRGVDRGACFSGPEDYRLYLGLMSELAPQFECRIHAYVLMTNHVHLLLSPGQPRACSWLMKNLGQRYAQAINKRWRRSGPLWEGRFKSCLVDSDRYALTCQRYIELNPVRAGMVRHPAQYHWSSYRHNALGAASTLLTPLVSYTALGSDDATRRLAYRAIFDTPPADATVREIRKAVQGGFALGSAEFLERIALLLGQRAARRNRVDARSSDEWRTKDRQKGV